MSRLWYSADAHPWAVIGFPEELLPAVRGVIQTKTIDGQGFAWASTAELTRGAPVPVRVGRTDRWQLDLGGMWVSGQPVEELCWNGLRIGIASDDANSLAARLRRRELSTDVFTRYEIVTFPGMHLLVLPEDMPSLVAAVADLAPEAARRAKAFFDPYEKWLRSKAVRA